MNRVLRGLAVVAAPVFLALWVGATTFPGGTMFFPWRPQMVDLDVYRRAGGTLLAGGDIYALPGSLPFLYPPFAALLALPMALLPVPLVQVLWTAVGALAVVAILHRFGLTGWPLSLVASAAVYFAEPVTQTLAFGQVGIVLVALVVLDLVPGPRVLPGRRLLPLGLLTGLSAAIKLTPAIFWIYLMAARRYRDATVLLVTAAVVTVVTAIIAPGVSIDFWGRLLHGDTGLGMSIIYYTNQSVVADVIRILGVSPSVLTTALLLAAVVAALGCWAAVAWHRLGDVPLAVSVCGIAGLLASPVSWSHHFVWVLPFALCLWGSPYRGRVVSPRPDWFLVLGWVFVGWVVAAPFRRLPNGGNVELQWRWFEQALATTTAVLGIVVVIASIVVARQVTRSRSAAPAISAQG